MTMTMTQQGSLPRSPDVELTDRLYEMYQTARRAKQTKLETWRRNYLLAMNRWGRSPDDPRDSEIYPILRARASWMTDQETRFNIDPATEPYSTFYDYEMKLGDQLETLLNSAYRVGSWNRDIAMALWDAPIYGAGILKAGWDSGALGGLGDITLARVDPWGFYPDPNGTSDEDCGYYFEVHKWGIDEITRRFPNVPLERLEAAIAAGDRGQMDGSPQKQEFPRYTRDGIPLNLGQGPVAVGLPGQGTTQRALLNQGVNVYECWVHENVETERESTDPNHESPEVVIKDQWRVIVFTNDVILLNETAEDLFDIDRHPYFRFVDDEIGEFWSTALVSHLAPLQLFINQLLSAAASNILLISNPVFVDYEDSGIGRTAITNRPGQRLTLKKSIGQQNLKPDWLSPPQMSQDIPSLIEFSIGRMENIAGLSAVSKGQQPAGRQAQQTIQSVQESGFVSIRGSLRNLETTLSKLGEYLIHILIVNYDIPRVVAIVGQEGEAPALRLAAWHFWVPTKEGKVPLKCALTVNAGSSAPTSRQARVAEADALYAMHAIPRKYLLETHRIPHASEMAQEMDQKDAEAAQAALAAKGGQGQPRGPGTGHPH